MIMAHIENDVQSAAHSDVDSVWKNINDFTQDNSSINSSLVPVENQVVPADRNLLLSYDFTSRSNKFYCYVCGKSFNFHYQLVHHKKFHRRRFKNPKIFNCKYCGKKFGFKLLLKNHIRSRHSPDQNNKGMMSIDDKSIAQTEKTDVENKNWLKCFHQTVAVNNSAESTVQAMSNDCDSNTRNEKNSMYSTASEQQNSSDVSHRNNNLAEQTAASHANVINKLISVKKEKPEDNNYCLLRETEYLVIRKSLEYTCKICKKYVSADLHSFATHMITHNECSMHECTVCDVKFPNITSWTGHMLNHEERSLNFTNAEINRNEVMESTNNTNNSESTELEVVSHRTLRGSNSLAGGSVKEEGKPEDCRLVRETQYFIVRNLLEYKCKICKKYLSVDRHSFAVHMISHRECTMHECTVCDLKFPSVIFWANHMLNHEELRSVNLSYTEIDCRRNVVAPNSNISTTNSESVEPPRLRNRNLLKDNKVVIAAKSFEQRPNETTNQRKLRFTAASRIDDDNRNESVNKTLSSTAVIDTNPSVSSEGKNFNNSVDVIADNASTNKLNCCKICRKQFANPKSLALHTRIHSKLKCQCCHRTFSRKGAYTNHMKCHNNFNVVIENVNNDADLMKGRLRVKTRNNFKSVVNGSFSDNPTITTNPTKKNRLWFSCDACEKKYSTPDQLIIHRVSHRDDNGPYLCKICEKSYSLRFRWNRHLRSHYEMNKIKSKRNRPIRTLRSKKSKVNNIIVQHQNNRIHYRCYFCNKMFRTVVNCKKHLKYFHKVRT